jgi:hypothetical protein
VEIRTFALPNFADFALEGHRDLGAPLEADPLSFLESRKR